MNAKRLKLGAATSWLSSMTVLFFLTPAVAGPNTSREVFVRIDQSENPNDFIRGEASAAGFNGWIKAVAVGQGFDQASRDNQGRPENPRMDDFTIVKKVDRATPLMMDALIDSKKLAKVTVVQTANIEGGTRHRSVIIELHNVVISDVHLSSGGLDRVFVGVDSGERPTEEVSFGYERVRWVYTPLGKQGPEPPVESEFDTLFGTGDPGSDSDLDGVPNSSDSDDDDDGIPDRYELAFGLDPFTDDAQADMDGDGHSNLEEYLAGTAAHDPLSFFSISSIEFSAGDRSSATIVFPILPMRHYRVMASQDGQSWVELSGFSVPSDETNEEAEIIAPIGGATRLFRIEVSAVAP